ncbi:MAG: acyltransferase [Muribaculaceae bacterium]|nr:acyltransferase [Muribaculaceae bacterium]MDE6320975.1 acyltransferase [Muribaculaceae bacterium]
MKTEEFQDIAPYNDDEFKEKMALMADDPLLEHAVRFVYPGVDYPEFVKQLKSIDNIHDFQFGMMLPFIEMLEKRTTDGVSCDNIVNIDPNTSYTFITNHRDIVLDATFLNLCFMHNSLPTSEIAIGNNLLIYEWIEHLVKLNQSFIVKRDMRMTEALKAAHQLSGYIHYCLNTKHRSVWIAQREGRAKDSNDLTQESLVKMLGLEGSGSILDNLLECRLMPVSITYEFDPNDYLKAREFLKRHNDPEFKKSKRDDLFSMETGMLGYKGRVHFTIGQCINEKLSQVPADSDRAKIVHKACSLIDNSIHCGYKLFPINYIAYDELMGDNLFREHYNEEDVKKVNDYISQQLSKVDEPDLTADDYEYMRSMMLQMYANPLTNKLRAIKMQRHSMV